MGGSGRGAASGLRRVADWGGFFAGARLSQPAGQGARSAWARLCRPGSTRPRPLEFDFRDRVGTRGRRSGRGTDCPAPPMGARSLSPIGIARGSNAHSPGSRADSKRPIHGRARRDRSLGAGHRTAPEFRWIVGDRVGSAGLRVRRAWFRERGLAGGRVGPRGRSRRTGKCGSGPHADAGGEGARGDRGEHASLSRYPQPGRKPGRRDLRPRRWPRRMEFRRRLSLRPEHGHLSRSPRSQ